MTPNPIKVHVTLDPPCGNIKGESLWATPISEDTAKLDNIPFYATHLSLGDLVRIDAEGEVLDVLEKAARSRHATYPSGGSHAAVQRRCLEPARP